MALENILGIAAGVCTSASLIPQLIKTIKKKDAKDVSIGMFIVLLAGNGLWVWYGFMKGEPPIYITNLMSVGFDITMIVLALKFRK